MLLLIDNYDSFTYNLFQYLSELGAEVHTVRNDQITPDEIEQLAPERIVVSPGPGRPDDGGISIDVIGRFAGKVPILGVCLGHQCIGQAFGGEVAGAGEIMHGKSSEIAHDGKGIFRGLPNPFEAIRYHSLAITPAPPRVSDRGHPVPPGEHHDAGGEGHPQELPGNVSGMLESFHLEDQAWLD